MSLDITKTPYLLTHCSYRTQPVTIVYDLSSYAKRRGYYHDPEARWKNDVQFLLVEDDGVTDVSIEVNEMLCRYHKEQEPISKFIFK